MVRTGITNPTGREAVRYLMANVTEHLSNPNCRAYVFMLDKIKFIYKIKGIEHKKRSLSRDVIPAPDPIQGVPLLPLDDVIPHRWESIMANRKTRMSLIDEMARLILAYFHPPRGKTLILDGALLDDLTSPVAIQSSDSDRGE
jgi:hypothetical protein